MIIKLVYRRKETKFLNILKWGNKKDPHEKELY